MQQEKYLELAINDLKTSVLSRLDKMEEKLDTKASHNDLLRLETRLVDLDNKKLEKSEFDPYRITLNKILRLVLSGIIGGVLLLIIKT